MPPHNKHRLPTDVRPTKYILTLTPDLSKFTFEGEEAIEVEVVRATSSIVLNAVELTISSARVKTSDGKTLVASQIDLDEPAERAILSFDEALSTGKAELALVFNGALNDQLRGFYRSKYKAADGSERYMTATQFEATDARRAFPCWDEPSLKATFQITLVIPEYLTAVSNTEVVKETPAGNGYRAVQFAETPRMSTYLLAFIVGDLACVQEKTSNGTLMRVWATRGNEHLGQFALETAVKLLAYYNNYFGTPYPLNKLDHLAIPDFAAGAMENWGAITYRETALLFDPQNSAAQTKQRIVEIVAHEMAHMWFGDLVTMDWWDGLWLNESFASWMGNKATAHLYPKWEMWTQFLSMDTFVGMKLDGLKNSHAIEQAVKDPAEIRELFDAISYSKGAATLWMLEQYLGEETFQRGLQRYISTHQYGNAKTDDLWKAMAEVSGEGVTALMNSWVRQTGFPLVSAEIKRGKSGVALLLSQNRFLYEHLIKGKEDDKTLWQVPIAVISRGGRKDAFLMTEHKASGTLIPNGEMGKDWIKGNAGQTGFYRVNYSEEEWARLKEAVEAMELPATDRLGLQNDAFALCQAGFVPASLYLHLSEAYVNEESAPIWEDLAMNLRALEALILDEPFLNQFYSQALKLFRPIGQKVGWNPKPEEGHLEALRRSVVLGRLGAYGDLKAITEAQKRFEGYLRGSLTLHPDIRAVVFGIVAQESDRLTYDALWKMYNDATLHEEKMRILGSLARPKDPDLILETLERAMSDEVRSQDTVLVIAATAANRHGRDLTWDFVKKNWEELDRRYSKGGFMITRLVSITQAFTLEERAAEVEAFFREHPVPAASRTVQQSLERIHLNAAWLQRNREELAAWFSKK